MYSHDQPGVEHLAGADNPAHETFLPALHQGIQDLRGFLGSSDGKESACNVGDSGSNLWVGKIPRRKKWQHTPVFLPGKFHGQRSLVGYSPWGHKELDPTEKLECTHTHTHTHTRHFFFMLLLLLLLSRFSRARLCATPETAAHQAPPSLGFSRQEH